jgi:hypothetical protein
MDRTSIDAGTAILPTQIDQLIVITLSVKNRLRFNRVIRLVREFATQTVSGFESVFTYAYLCQIQHQNGGLG